MVVKLLWPEEQSEVAESLVERCAGRLAAPHLLSYEVTSVVRHARRAGTTAEREKLLDEFHALPIRQLPLTPELHRQALTLAVEKNTSSYDAAYVILARSLGTSLVTADAKLVRAMRDPKVVPLSEDRPEDA